MAEPQEAIPNMKIDNVLKLPIPFILRSCPTGKSTMSNFQNMHSCLESIRFIDKSRLFHGCSVQKINLSHRLIGHTALTMSVVPLLKSRHAFFKANLFPCAQGSLVRVDKEERFRFETFFRSSM